MKVEIVVNSHVMFNCKELSTYDVPCFHKLQKRFTYSNPVFFQTQQMGYSTRNIPKKIYSFSIREKSKNMLFSRGTLRIVKSILKSHGHTVKIVDKRFSHDPVIYMSNIKLREEQVEPVEMILKKQQGIIRGPCSSGKTCMLLEAIARASQMACVIVWDKNLQKQWIREATDNQLLNLNDNEIGGCGGVFKKPRVRQLNICMQQSLCNPDIRDLYNRECGFLGADEVQRFAARTFQEVINNFEAKYRIGVSADEKRKDGKQFLIYDSFGKVIYEMADHEIASRLKAQIVLVATDFYCEQWSIDGRRDSLLKAMSVDKKRNQRIFNFVSKSVQQKKICLVLVEYRRHALELLFMFKKHFKAKLICGDVQNKDIRESDWPDKWKQFMFEYDTDEEFPKIKELAEKRKLDVIVATSKKGDQGISIRTLDHLFIGTPNSDLARFNQQKGRVERDYNDELREKFGNKGTPKVFYFWDVRHDKLKDAGGAIQRKFKGVEVIRRKEN